MFIMDVKFSQKIMYLLLLMTEVSNYKIFGGK